MAKTVFVLIFTILISVTLKFPVFAAEITRPTPKIDRAGGLSVSSTVGGYFFAGSEQRNATPLYGVKIGYENIERSFVDSLGIEGTLNYFSSRSKAAAKNDTGYLFRLDVTYPLPINKKWMPYIAVGAGGITINNTANSSSNLLLNYGVGVKYFFENYLAVRADVRQLGVSESSRFRNNYEIGLGVSYYFGKERTKTPAAPPVPEKKKIVVPEDAPAKIEEVSKPADADKGENAADKSVAVNQPVPADPEASVSPVVKNEVVKKLSVEFDKNSSSIKPNYFMRLKEVADTLNVSDDLSVQIVGHIDIVGKLAAQKTLSEQRTKSVRGSLINLGVTPTQISITAHEPEPPKPIADKTKLDGRQQGRRVDILVVKIDAAAKLKAEQDLQFEAERAEIERLQAERLAKARIKATVVLQEVSGVSPVDSNSNLSFAISNQGLSTEEFLLALIAPKEFEGFLTRANRPDEKVTLLQLASGETFKGSVLLRIPAGMADGHKATVSVKAVSTKYSDVFFQKDSHITCSAPLVRVAAKLSRQEVTPGEKLRYHLTVNNAGSLSARNLTIKLKIPPQVDLVGTPDMPFTQDTTGMIIFKVDAIESGKRAEMNIDLKVREMSAIGQELIWNVEVIEGSLQRRVKSTERATVVRSK